MEFIPKVTEGNYDAWQADYVGHELLLVNGPTVRLYYDGKEIVRKSGVCAALLLWAELPDDKKTIMICIDGTQKNHRFVVTAVVGDKVGMKHGSVAISDV